MAMCPDMQNRACPDTLSQALAVALAMAAAMRGASAF